MTWRDGAVDKTRIYLENMLGEWELMRAAGMNVTPAQVAQGTLGKIVEIAESSFPLARVMDASDIVFHAEGPGASRDLPWLGALNWLSHIAESNLRRLSASALDMLGVDGAKIARHLDMRIPGIAHASLWIGIKLMPPESDLLKHDPSVFDNLLNQIGTLPAISRFIDDEGLRPGLDEMQPDPAMRDVQLEALYRFAPTGNKGIHTLQMQTKAHGAVGLGQRERVVLREALNHPSTKLSKEGSFIGEMRAADLDKNRMLLRSVSGIGALRCVMPAMSNAQVREIFGNAVKVHGRYQCDKQGRPRLMFVERVEPLPQTKALV